MNPLLHTTIRAAGFGFVAGLRTATGPAAVSATAGRDPGGLRGTRLAFLAQPRTRVLLLLSAAGEFVVDKFPFVPSRTQPAPLLVRVGVGAATGAVVSVQARKPVILGVAAGAMGGFLGTHAGYRWRMLAHDHLHTGFVISGIVEDGVAAGAGYLLAVS